MCITQKYDSMTVHLMKHYYEVPIWRGGRGRLLKPVNKTSLVTGLFAVCFS